MMQHSCERGSKEDGADGQRFHGEQDHRDDQNLPNFQIRPIDRRKSGQEADDKNRTGMGGSVEYFRNERKEKPRPLKADGKDNEGRAGQPTGRK